MLEIAQTSQFKKDLRKILRSGRCVFEDLRKVIEVLSKEENIDIRCRECHIKLDWLLIYRIEPEILWFVRTGSHEELFG